LVYIKILFSYLDSFFTSAQACASTDSFSPLCFRKSPFLDTFMKRERERERDEEKQRAKARSCGGSEERFFLVGSERDDGCDVDWK